MSKRLCRMGRGAAETHQNIAIINDFERQVGC